MTGAADFARLVPGFDFLQGLMRSAGNALPDMGKWIAPTLDPEELGKRIDQLKTVQVWLEQNARMLGATVQALEVQRMTLATLKSMNVPVADLGEALKARAGAPARDDPPGPPIPTSHRGRARAAAGRAAPAPAPAPASPGAPLVDPMQWWGALTQQFTQLAAQAIKEGPMEAARSAAGNLAEAAGRAAKPADPPASTTPPAAGTHAPGSGRQAKQRAVASRASGSKLK